MMMLLRFVPLILVVSVAAACGDGSEGRTPSPASVPPDNMFDPGAVSVGDSVAGLEIVHRDVRRVFGDSAWTGTVRFRGPLTLDGVYQRHFDYPEPDELCFHVLGASISHVPQFEPDAFTSPGMKTWFCFTNPDRVRQLLGDASTPREATVVVDDYNAVRQFTDAYATATLVGVTRSGDTTRSTLRDPR